MDLLDVLEIDRQKLPHQTALAVDHFKTRWEKCGRPTEPRALARVLDEGLRFCAEAGWRYPKVFLLRLKQLERGEWATGQVKGAP